MSNKTLMLSIRPQYAEKIFRGTKRVELRKVKPNIAKGDLVLVYVSSPVQELYGKFEVEKVVAQPLEELWETVHLKAGVTRREFDNYYEGTSIGYGIFLHSPVSIKSPLTLNELRRIWRNFYPPQGYKYLSAAELSLVAALA